MQLKRTLSLSFGLSDDQKHQTTAEGNSEKGRSDYWSTNSAYNSAWSYKYSRYCCRRKSGTALGERNKKTAGKYSLWTFPICKDGIHTKAERSVNMSYSI